jgi:hypothetical protein
MSLDGIMLYFTRSDTIGQLLEAFIKVVEVKVRKKGDEG